MKNTLLAIALLLLSTSSFSQVLEKDTTEAYPYVLPIWADKVIERGMGDQMQLPFGFSAHYVNVFIDLEITEFGLALNGQDLSGIINKETLNFQSVSATTNGTNLRADAWVLPFLNVYGLFSAVTGSTEVSLQPSWTDATGEVILEMPEFGSKVEFDAIAYGLGATMIYGFDNYFMSSDFNFSKTETELLKDQVLYGTFSVRAGRRFMLSKTNKHLMLATYVGAMYRNFLGADGNNGSIGMDEVFPEADATFNQVADEKKAENQAAIDALGPFDPQRVVLEARNAAIQTIQDGVNNSGFFTSTVDYFIRKEMIQAWTFQFGFNLQLNKHWALRGEYGVSDSQRFLMSGLQYRFGL